MVHKQVQIKRDLFALIQNMDDKGMWLWSFSDIFLCFLNIHV